MDEKGSTRAAFLTFSACAFWQLQLKGFQSFPSFLSAVRMFSFCCAAIPTNQSFSWLGLEFTFACISSSLSESADSGDCARV